MSDPLLTARALRKTYGRGDTLVRAVDDVDLDVPRGDRRDDGAERLRQVDSAAPARRPRPPDAGQVILSGQHLDKLGERGLARLRRDAVGFVFQGFHLMDELTAVENVELPQLLAGRSPRAARRARLHCWTERVWKTAPSSCRPRCPAASGSGSRSLARSPTTRWSCSPTSRRATWTAPRRSRCSGCSTTCTGPGQTLVIVTHDSRIAATADRLISMRDGAFTNETRLTGADGGLAARRLELEG